MPIKTTITAGAFSTSPSKFQLTIEDDPGPGDTYRHLVTAIVQWNPDVLELVAATSPAPTTDASASGILVWDDLGVGTASPVVLSIDIKGKAKQMKDTTVRTVVCDRFESLALLESLIVTPKKSVVTASKKGPVT